jgi:hypothetical protein
MRERVREIPHRCRGMRLLRLRMHLDFYSYPVTHRTRMHGQLRSVLEIVKYRPARAVRNPDDDGDREGVPDESSNQEDFATWQFN